MSYCAAYVGFLDLLGLFYVILCQDFYFITAFLVLGSRMKSFNIYWIYKLLKLWEVSKNIHL
jgi:hypothetical protein